jgi:amidophosphoribosyltransferase
LVFSGLSKSISFEKLIAVFEAKPMFKWKSLCSLLFLLLFVPGVAVEIDDPSLHEEKILHECGIALVRLRKPLNYYAQQYGDPAWGTKKLLRLMEKQRNRGQDGAGIAVVKLDMPSGQEYLRRLRTMNGVDTLFEEVSNDLVQSKLTSSLDEVEWKKESSFIGEVLLGHVRYATFSSAKLENCQPFIRPHVIASHHFALAGNFNMTNTTELFKQLEDCGIFPTSPTDTQTILNMIAYHLDKEHDAIENQMTLAKSLPLNGRDRNDSIFKQIDLSRVLSRAAAEWDGGYLLCGILGNGEAFVCRDPAGIRPGFYFMNDEVIAVASEKAALASVFDVQLEAIMPIRPGHVLNIKHNGDVIESLFKEPLPQRECTFERIYFSNANDPQIYQERKALGKQLASKVLDALKGDLEHVIFTYVPSSSQAAFQGLIEELTHQAQKATVQKIKEKLEKGDLKTEEIEKLVALQPQTEVLITKNQKLRTFISSDHVRKTLALQLYEVTKGIVTPETTLVVVDDSIVRGITLRESLIKKLIGLNPKKIVIVSSAPPVLYPDCYGIDMSQIGRFVGFEAAISFLKEQGQTQILETVEHLCLKQKDFPPHKMENAVRKIFEKLTLDQISQKIAHLITPQTEWKGSVEVIYQSLEGLKQALPDFSGDWYFSGNYPTPGGYKVLNDSFLKWMENDDSRVY